MFGTSSCCRESAIFLFLIFSLSSISPAHAEDSPPIPIVLFGADQYQFPRNVRDFMPDEAGSLHSMSLRLIYPEMEGRTPSNSRAMSLPSQRNRSIQLLLRDDSIPGDKVVLTPQQSLNLQVWYGLTRQHYSLDKIEELEVHSYNLIQRDFDRALVHGFDELTLRPEIKVEPLDYLRRGMQRGERRFIKTFGKGANVFIACRSPKVSKNPNCNMWFAFRDIYVKANFVLAMLPEWNGIQRELKNYFEKHRVKQ